MEPALPIAAKREAWFIPVAIIVAGLIFSVAVYVHRANQVQGSIAGDISLLRPVALTDHIIGNPSAPVTIVTYADIDSAPAKLFQATLEQLMAEYAASGNVAWVYRHLPLIDQHVFAASHAEAAECVSAIGGPSLFWRFINTVNAQAPGDQQFNPDDYPTVITALGILPEAFQACMQEHRFEKVVSNDFTNGMAIGAEGSPFSVLLVKGLPPVTINGAVPYTDLKRMIDGAIKQAAAAQPAS